MRLLIAAGLVVEAQFGILPDGSVPVPGCVPVTLDCGEDCELSGVYECTSYYNNRGWWVKGGVSFENTTPHGNTTHTEMFQIWWNDENGESWRIGYTHHYWFVNLDSHDWAESKWEACLKLIKVKLYSVEDTT